MALSLRYPLSLFATLLLVHTLAEAQTSSDPFIHSRAAYYPNSDEQGTDSKTIYYKKQKRHALGYMLWYIITKTSMFLSILLIELQVAHVGLVPLELQSMVGMCRLHLTSTEMALAVGLATRYIGFEYGNMIRQIFAMFFQHSHAWKMY